MNTVKYRVRLVLESNEEPWRTYQVVRAIQLFDPHPSLDLAMQEFDDILHTVDEKRRVEGLREGEY